VARAIYHATVPVISAVGHETDVTIADFVADRRAPTPSAAAEIVVAAKEEFSARIARLAGRLRSAALGRIQSKSRRVHVLSGRSSLAGFPGRVAMRGRHVSELTHALARAIRTGLATRERRAGQARRRLESLGYGKRLADLRARLVGASGRLDGAFAKRHHRANAQLRGCAARLEALSPLGVLGRGYAVAWNADRTRVLRSAGDTTEGDRIHVRLAQGELDCEVRGRTT
jgi:exodeoxyribonuclease VII large subunit